MSTRASERAGRRGRAGGALLALAACAAAAVPALAAEESEPNDTEATATTLRSGRSYEAKISRLDDAAAQRPGDVDFFALDAAAGPVDIAYTALQEQGSCFGPEARLIDADGATLGATHPPKGETGHIRYTAPADAVLYVRVQAYHIDSCPAPISYRLRADFTEAIHGGDIDGFVVDAKHRQKQRGKRIEVSLAVGAAERIHAIATGTVRAGRKQVKLRRDAASVEAGRRGRLVLVARGRPAKQVATAIAEHGRAKAKITVAATDSAGDSSSRRLRIELR